MAGALILVAGFFDGIDGKVARLTKTTSRFGLELDSLADVISFGVAPALLIYIWALAPYRTHRLGECLRICLLWSTQACEVQCSIR